MQRRVNWDLVAGSFALLVFLAFAGYNGGCGPSSEGMVAHAMSGWMQEYQKHHDGRLPTNWNELQQVVERPVDEVLSYAMPTKRYAFVSPPLPLTGQVQGKLLALNRSAIWDMTLECDGARGPGRYLIYQQDDGRLIYQWVEESKVKALFTAAGMALPTPDGVPERPAVTHARRMMYLLWGLFALDISVLLYVLGKLAWKVVTCDVPWAYDV